MPSASSCRTWSLAAAAPDCSAADIPRLAVLSPIRGCPFMLSTMSSQLKVSNAASMAASKAAASRYGRPAAIARANVLDAQHARTSRSASGTGAALNEPRVVDAGGCELGFAMRTSNQGRPDCRTPPGKLNHR